MAAKDGVVTDQGMGEMVDYFTGEATDTSDDIDTVEADDLIQEDGDDVEDSDDIDGDDDDEDDSVDDDDSDDSDSDDLADDRESKLDRLLEKLTDKVTEKDDDGDTEDTEVNVYEDGTYDKVVDALDLDKDESKVLQSFLDKLLQQNTKLVISKVLEEVPNLVNREVSTSRKQDTIKGEFFEQNPELKGKDKLLNLLAKEVASEGKHKELKSVLNETAKRAYELLGVKKGKAVESEDVRSKRKPAFPKSKTSRKKTVSPTGINKEIDDMLSLDY